jgi:hypothetical protein
MRKADCESPALINLLGLKPPSSVALFALIACAACVKMSYDCPSVLDPSEP